MRTTIAFMMTILPLLAAGVQAQGPGSSMTMICPTSDGTVTISERTVTLADYQLHFDDIIADGIVRYSDPRSNVIAVLDARDDQGLYLQIEENGVTMQVVAARSLISYRFDKSGNEPAAPSWSALTRYINPASDRKN
ncbi:MAG: hypothetical protein RRA94_13045 [Bacteroidota bacterium]|nr:hypothetical protein [Bacteroidota bacterium]